MASEHLEILRQEAGCMNAGEHIGERPFVGGDLQRKEVLPSGRERLGWVSEALAEVEQEAAILLFKP